MVSRKQVMLLWLMVLIGLPCSTSLASTADQITFSVDVGEFFYPYASVKDNQSAMKPMMADVSVIGHYTEEVTHERLKLASCMIGVVCFPDPHRESVSETKDHVVTQKVAGEATSKNVWRLNFQLPAQDHGRPLSEITLAFPLASLWQQPSVRQALTDAQIRLPSYDQQPGWQAAETARIDLQPVNTGKPIAYSNGCLNISEPHGYSGYGMVRLRAISDGANQSAPPAYMAPKSCYDDGAKTADGPSIPAAAKDLEFSRLLPYETDVQPERDFSPQKFSANVVQVIMPTSDARWSGLTHVESGQVKDGVIMSVEREGALTWLEITANEDSGRMKAKQSPQRTERWMLYDGRVVSYRGWVKYPAGNPAPNIAWGSSYIEGTLLASWIGHGDAIGVSLKGDQICRENGGCETQGCVGDTCYEDMRKICRWDACRREMAMATAWAARKPDAVQDEALSYLQIFDRASHQASRATSP